MPGPLAQRGGKGAPHRPPPMSRPSPPTALRRFTAVPPTLDHASALPPEVVRALRLVAAELRDMPRDCARDREELVHWHGRLARRLDAVVTSKTRGPAAATTSRIAAKVEAPIAAAVQAPAAPKRIAGADQVLPDGPRILPTRTAPATRWRARPADTAFWRRSEAAGQLRLFALR